MLKIRETMRISQLPSPVQLLIMTFLSFPPPHSLFSPLIKALLQLLLKPAQRRDAVASLAAECEGGEADGSPTSTPPLKSLQIVPPSSHLFSPHLVLSLSHTLPAMRVQLSLWLVWLMPSQMNLSWQQPSVAVRISSVFGFPLGSSTGFSVSSHVWWRSDTWPPISALRDSGQPFCSRLLNSRLATVWKQTQYTALPIDCNIAQRKCTWQVILWSQMRQNIWLIRRTQQKAFKMIFSSSTWSFRTKINLVKMLFKRISEALILTVLTVIIFSMNECLHMSP